MKKIRIILSIIFFSLTMVGIAHAAEPTMVQQFGTQCIAHGDKVELAYFRALCDEYASAVWGARASFLRPYSDPQSTVRCINSDEMTYSCFVVVVEP